MRRGTEDQRDTAGVETIATLNRVLDLDSQTGPQSQKKSCLKTVVGVGVCVLVGVSLKQELYRVL